MKKAYIIMAHKNPLQVHRLVARLNDGKSSFFIHIDKTVNIAPFRMLEEYGHRLNFIERADSKWGGFGSVQAALNGLQAVKDTGQFFDSIFLLSGQDYPIKSNDFINDFLQNSTKSVFVEYDPIPNYQKWPGSDRGGLYRVDKYYLGLKRHELFCSKAMNFSATYLPFFRRKIPNGMKPFTGSAWWSVDMYALNYILDYNAAHPNYRAFHRFTFVPDEVYINMMIGGAKDQKLRASLENNNKRLIIWENFSDAHPKTFRAGDFDTILASEQLFARKFDETADAGIMDLIDQHILFKAQDIVST